MFQLTVCHSYGISNVMGNRRTAKFTYSKLYKGLLFQTHRAYIKFCFLKVTFSNQKIITLSFL